jgi:hypothetical protein
VNKQDCDPFENYSPTYSRNQLENVERQKKMKCRYA